MKTFIPAILFLSAIAIYMTGCSRPQEIEVSSTPEYNFSSFTNTVWKTKVKIALADAEQYTGKHVPTLIAPRNFDTNHPQYLPSLNFRVVSFVPVGSRVRIGRLMKDNGNWGGFRVNAIMENGTMVNIDRLLLAKNLFLYDSGTSTSTNWGVDPDLLEAVKPE